MLKNFKPQALTIFLLVVGLSLNAQVFKGTNGQIKFTSVAPLETIMGVGQTLQSLVNVSTMQFNFRQKPANFTYTMGNLQKQHANENFFEIDKHPYIKYVGTIINAVDLTKPGTYPVTTKGKMTMHGVTVPIKVPATVVVTASSITVTSSFDVFLSDYDMTIPALMDKKVADKFSIKLNMKLTQ